ncbi:hypothetical protein L083_0790 [Actinoplanes sp. N902-109]|nr:hypothetical protein L083_0790 [Actinoplanes sp. N902-109]
MIRANARTFSERATRAEAAGDGLVDIDTGAWLGKAGEAFRDKFSYEPGKWYDAANSLQTAAGALTTYADVLAWAQQQAAEAIRLWNEADIRSDQGRRDYQTALARATPGHVVPPFDDPGEAGRQAAQDTLASARRQVSDAAGQAASFLAAEADAAPEKSHWLDEAGDFFKDVGADVVNTLASFGNATLHHPGEFLTAAAGIGLTMVSAGGDGLGIALDATGVGAVVGVPLNVLSTAGVVAGAGLTAAAGASLMQHAATDDAVSPMRGSEPVRSAPRKTDRLKEHLTEKDLDGARRELNGEVVARKSDGTPWDHVDEVRNAQRGLVNRIKQLKREIGDSRSSEEQRAAAQEELSEASRLLDHSEQYVPRLTE